MANTSLINLDKIIYKVGGHSTRVTRGHYGQCKIPNGANCRPGKAKFFINWKYCTPFSLIEDFN